ncbi:hypothetical protein CCP3SC1_450031 [Gammaproteobacteria bacterium]
MSNVDKIEQPLLLGIDLGTSRTRIMSNRGVSADIFSVVGYPKDIIGVKLMKHSYLIGEEALRRQSIWISSIRWRMESSRGQ